MRRLRLVSPSGPEQVIEIPQHTVEMRALANPLVRRRARAVERDVHRVESTRHALLGAALGEQCRVRVGADPDPARDGVPYHVEEARVHHRLAQTLKMQLAEARQVSDDVSEQVEIHERRRAVRRAVRPELDRTHLTAQVALPHGLELDVGRRRNRPPRLEQRKRFHQNATRKVIPPRMRWYTESSGTTIDVTMTSMTCGVRRDV